MSRFDEAERIYSSLTDPSQYDKYGSLFLSFRRVSASQTIKDGSTEVRVDLRDCEASMLIPVRALGDLTQLRVDLMEALRNVDKALVRTDILYRENEAYAEKAMREAAEVKE